MMKSITVVLAIFNFQLLCGQGKKVIEFQSEDKVTVSADLYMPHPKSSPLIILFHQANWSRGEYNEIAPELNTLGYNCLAVDLRSGGAINSVTNLTKLSASKAMKATQYVDALPDMRAAIRYAKNQLTDGKLIIWGSSYSSALALKLAGTMKEVDAVLAFSPAEYFVSQGKPRDFVTSDAIYIEKPVFITSAKSEKGGWWGMYVAIPSDSKSHFLPETAGNHGSKALWSKFSDSGDYWKSVKTFLEGI